MAEEKYVEVRLVRSLIRESKRNKRTAIALGLRKPNSVRVHRLTPQIAGMIRRIQHMVEVRELSPEEIETKLRKK